MISSRVDLGRSAAIASLVCASLMSAMAFPAMAQDTRGRISGRVTDALGAVMPSVAVTAVNGDTKVSSAAVSNGSGVFTIQQLLPGPYD